MTLPTAPLGAPPLSTPVLVVEGAALDANIAAMQALASEHAVALRPHAKGHRAPWIAERQIAAGAVGIAVATVAEAALFVGAGVRDVLLTSVVAPGRADELAALAAATRRSRRGRAHRGGRAGVRAARRVSTA